MSPQSRGRRKKPTARGVRRPPRESNPLATFLRVFAPVLLDADPLQAETTASQILGPAFDPMRLPDAPDPMLALIDYLRGKETVPALCLAQSIAVVGWTEEQRTEAAEAAARLVDRGVSAPSWTAELGVARFVDAWQLRDVYGDQATLLCVFEQAGAQHGVFALLDFNQLGGYVEDFGVTDDVPEFLGDARGAEADSKGIAVLERIAPDRARRLIEDGVAATDMTIDPDIGDDYANYRAFALSRCRAMPAPAPSDEREFPREQRDELVERFLRECPAGSGSWRYLASLLVDYGCDYDAGQPLRVSPGKLAAFLLGYLPRKVILDEDDHAALPDVVRAWVPWAAASMRLPPAAETELDDAVADLLDDFEATYDDSHNASPVRAMLAGLGELSGKDELDEVLARRMFAMPDFGTRIGDEDFPRLDPSDEDERHLLIVGEHPEYHAALDDPDIDEMDRLDIIHEIGGAVVGQLHGALSSHEPIDVGAYTAALRELGPRRGKRSGKAKARASAVAVDAVYQVKITLRWSKPPIWRRLRLPATATLDALHWIIQAAFGWEDSHLHAFETGGRRYAPGEFELETAQSSDGVSLRSVLDKVGAKLTYTYDFGDGWGHELVVEKIAEPDGVGHAVCVGGRRSGPVEDCGGVGGWEYLCEVLADPSHPEHEERLEWLGYVPDPAAFDLDSVNAALARVPLSG